MMIRTTWCCFIQLTWIQARTLIVIKLINLLRRGLKHRIPPYPGTNPEPGRLLTQIAQKIFSEPGKYMETRIERGLSSYSQK